MNQCLADYGPFDESFALFYAAALHDGQVCATRCGDDVAVVCTPLP